MAIRFDSTSDYLERTANLPAWNLYSLSFWMYISSTSGNLVIFTIESSGGSTSNDFYLDASQILTVWKGDGGANGGGALSNTTWYHIGITKSASAILVYLNGAQVISTDQGASFTPAAIKFGISGSSFNGRLSYIKLWDATLTADEINAERFTVLPKRYANINGWYPTWPGTGERNKDYSGLGRDWTEGGTLTDEDGPPASWGAPVWVVGPVGGAPPPATSFLFKRNPLTIWTKYR
jgi:hypothetical protein